MASLRKYKAGFILDPVSRPEASGFVFLGERGYLPSGWLKTLWASSPSPKRSGLLVKAKPERAEGRTTTSCPSKKEVPLANKTFGSTRSPEVCVPPTMTLQELNALKAKLGFTGFPVTVPWRWRPVWRWGFLMFFGSGRVGLLCFVVFCFTVFFNVKANLWRFYRIAGHKKLAATKWKRLWILAISDDLAGYSMELSRARKSVRFGDCRHVLKKCGSHFYRYYRSQQPSS